MSINELEPTGTSPWPTWPGTHEPDLAPRGQTEPDNIAPTIAAESWPLLPESDTSVASASAEPWLVLAEHTPRPHEIMPGMVAEERRDGIALTRPRTAKTSAGSLELPDWSEVGMLIFGGMFVALPISVVVGAIHHLQSASKWDYLGWLLSFLVVCVMAIPMALLHLWPLGEIVGDWVDAAHSHWLRLRRPTLGTELLFPALPVRLGESAHVRFQQQRARGHLLFGLSPAASIRCEDWTKTSDSAEVLWRSYELKHHADAPCQRLHVHPWRLAAGPAARYAALPRRSQPHNPLDPHSEIHYPGQQGRLGQVRIRVRRPRHRRREGRRASGHRRGEDSRAPAAEKAAEET